MDAICVVPPLTSHTRRSAGRPPAGRATDPGQRSPGPRRGFTLIEMLTVVVIIGILASLVTGAVIRARIAARIAAIGLEISQLDAALKAYKQKHNRYPPDFSAIDTPQGRAAVIRHLENAFPRYNMPGNRTDKKWGHLQHRLLRAYGVNIDDLDPSAALVFWLGGLPEGPDSRRLIGFSANPRDPFDFGDLNGNGIHDPGESWGSRLPRLFEFDPGRLKLDDDGVWRYYPDTGGSGKNAPYVYFRASNRGYDGHPGFSSATHSEWGSTRPCFDTRVPLDASGTTFDWVNRDWFQIRAAGLDGVFGTGREFPTGGDYDDASYDDITNFSGGTLEDKM